MMPTYKTTPAGMAARQRRLTQFPMYLWDRFDMWANETGLVLLGVYVGLEYNVLGAG